MRALPQAPFEDVLEASGEEVRALMESTEERLAQVASAHGPQLARWAGSTLAAGGKRLRPLLVFVCGDAAVGEPLVRAATAVELVHMATLVHDDVIDRAPARRGHPTVYATAGRGAATMVGDLLFSRAFSVLAANEQAEQVRVLSEACLALARGELAQREDAYARGLKIERYLRRCELKTGRLFAAACRLGALAGRCAGVHAEALGRYGLKVGLAFQLLDDVLDVGGIAQHTGKQRGTDLLDGTVTMPLILAAASDHRLAGLDLRSVDSAERAEEVCDRIAATDALEETRHRAVELVAAGKAELGNGLDARVRSLLELVADRIVDRYA